MQTARGNFARGGNPNPLPEGIVFPTIDGVANVGELQRASQPPTCVPQQRVRLLRSGDWILPSVGGEEKRERGDFSEFLFF